MKKGIVNVLHITTDDKFFDSVFDEWKQDKHFMNKALFVSLWGNHKFKHIKNKENVDVIFGCKHIKEYLRFSDYDLVFFHSLPPRYYRLVKYIPDDKIVIWWMWGYDVYYSLRMIPALINIDLYKPITKHYVNNCFKPKELLLNLLWWMMRKKTRKDRDYAIGRIDFFQPVLKNEYDLIKRIPQFRAQEFYYKNSWLSFSSVLPKKADGDILIGNSATTTNNHLDVLNIIMNIKQPCQNIIMPLSYGNKEYTEWLNNKINNDSVIKLHDFMPKEDYFRLLNKCSYAIIGTLRQQAIGNVSFVLSQGIKLFLYRDSIIYKNYKELGFVVYTIEDMTMDSLKTPLTKDEIDINIKASIKEYNRRNTIYEHFINCMNNI